MEMTSVTPMSIWIPEDDIVLKNAIEAGASLEALAKGAVQFSRKFTYRELRDRWHSLLYDPITSAKASACMIEREVSTSNPAKFNNRLDNSKESRETHGKRKLKSIRRQYYAMRKRLKSEFEAGGLNFFAESNIHEYNGNGGQFEGHVELDNQPLDGACMSDHFEFQDVDYDILRNTFRETGSGIEAAGAIDGNGDAFDTAHQDLLEDNNRDRIAGNNYLLEFHEDNPSFPVKQPPRDDVIDSFAQNIASGDISHITEHSLVDFRKHSNVVEMVSMPPASDGKLFKTEESETNPLLASNSITGNLQTFCSGFGGKQQSCSPGSDCNADIHTSEFSSPLPTMPLWKTMEDISAPDMPVDMGLHVETHAVKEILTLPEDDDHKKKISETVYNESHSGPDLRDVHNGNGFINLTAISGGEFADLSDSLLNFSNDEDIVFMDVEGKDAIDIFNSTSLNSSADIHEGDVPSVVPTTSGAPNHCFASTSGVCPSESEVIASPSGSLHGDQKTVSHLEANMPSTSLLNSESVKPNEGLICTLNTEDTEIPCNDDIFLLIHPTSSFSSTIQAVTTDATNLVSSCANERLNLAKNPAQIVMQSQILRRNSLPETNHTFGSTIKSEFPDANYLDLVPRHTNKFLGDTSQGRIAHPNSLSAVDRPLGKDLIKIESVTMATSAEAGEMPSGAEAGPIKLTLPESASDQEESESGDDVPNYSDIEAMILEMDLGPSDQDSYISRQVSRYQLEDSKRTIVRLEQCARFSLQRALASQSAFAVLYGRRLKHYIRKTEVILGRSTNDVGVDIDLGIEGHANKISRRQAVIKIESNGTFVMKNLGKSTISVNGKAVATGQFLNLTSSCLIEIRGMSFVFETNAKLVRRYLDGIAKKSHGGGERSSRFEWRPEGET